MSIFRQLVGLRTAYPILATIGSLGCVHSTVSSPGNITICSEQWSEGAPFSNLAVAVYPDQHGDYAKIKSCPERNYAINFSESGLFDEENSELLRQMRFNASHGVQPINMVISGYQDTTYENGNRRNFLRVTRIIEYSLGN